MLYYFNNLILLYFMGTKFMFIYPFFYCILENEEELPIENLDKNIVSTLEQMKMPTFNSTLVNSV